MVGLAEVARRLGITAAADLAELSYRSVFLSWARYLVVGFGISEDRATSRTAELFRQCFELIGDELTREDERGNVILRHEKTRLSLPQYGWRTPPRQIEDAIARAWTIVSRAVGEEVVVSVEASSSGGESETIWRFSAN
jgi:hypothetical protein